MDWAGARLRVICKILAVHTPTMFVLSWSAIRHPTESLMAFFADTPFVV